MDLIFEIANTMIDQIAHHHSGDWPLTPEARRAACATKRSCAADLPGSSISITRMAEASA
jgi:nitrogenase molybdenum-iron protein NifN